MYPIVRNIQNDDLYKFLGGNKFVNLRTGKSGEVADEKAKEIFKMNIEATEIINQHPAVESLINRLKLKMDTSEWGISGVQV
jgi:hypothetical protein